MAGDLRRGTPPGQRGADKYSLSTTEEWKGTVDWGVLLGSDVRIQFKQKPWV